jgi:hypothetical protein
LPISVQHEEEEEADSEEKREEAEGRWERRSYFTCHNVRRI